MTGKGRLITFEGIDGTGKTTQSAMLAENLEELGHRVMLTREPGGTRGAELIRDLLLNDRNLEWSVESEILLFFAARCDHVDRIIRPALDEGTMVICDRYTDSTRVYQAASDRHEKLIEEIHSSVIGLDPDLTFIMLSSQEIARKRVGQRNEVDIKFGRMDMSEVDDLAIRFEALASRYHERCHRIDASRKPDVLARDILEIVLGRIGLPRSGAKGTY